ncbi:MAG: AIR synthase family protein [Bacillota bacterium]
MRVGKLLNNELIKEVLSKVTHFRPEVVVGAGLGEDCASLSTDKIILISTDPITAEVADIGSLAITVATNDIYASGGVPMALSLTILMPTSATAEQVGEIMECANAKAVEIGAEIIGGHTEFTDAVVRPVVTVTALGIAENHLQTTNLVVGDSIIITKHIALEGTAILATQYENMLKDVLTEQELLFAKGLSKKTSIAKDARIATSCKARTMHDITEGGIYGALAEICQSSSLGAEISVDSIPKLDISQKICNHLGINIYGLISSGSLLITTPDPDAIIAKCKNEDINATVIGKIVATKGAYALQNEKRELLCVKADELFKLLEK